MATTRHFDCFNACSIQASPANRGGTREESHQTDIGQLLSVCTSPKKQSFRRTWVCRSTEDRQDGSPRGIRGELAVIAQW